MRIGTRLLSLREDRKLSQAAMADLLGVSSPTYSRLERNEASVDLEQVVNFSKILQVPVQEFLPETITINGNNQSGQIGLVIGNVNHYSDREQTNQIEKLHLQLMAKDQEVTLLKEQIENLKKINALLEDK